MLLAVFQFTVGLGLLIFGADRLVFGSLSLAKHFNLSPLFIGLTIVAIGTSAPEIFISIMAVFEDTPEIAIGNAIGSNIANIALVIGICAIIKPLTFPPKLFKTEFPLLLFISCLIAFLLWDNSFAFLEGLLCLALFIGFLGFYAYCGLEQPSVCAETATIPTHSLQTALIWIIFGLILLPLSSDLLILGAKKIALFLGAPKLLIGLTLIALGTSLPELATSVISTLKGRTDIAIGNIIGSNICNLTAVLAPIGLFQKTALPAISLTRDLIFMLILTFALAFFNLFRKNNAATRLEGILFFISYIGYLLFSSLFF